MIGLLRRAQQMQVDCLVAHAGDVAKITYRSTPGPPTSGLFSIAVRDRPSGFHTPSASVAEGRAVSGTRQGRSPFPADRGRQASPRRGFLRKILATRRIKSPESISRRARHSFPCSTNRLGGVLNETLVRPPAVASGCVPGGDETQPHGTDPVLRIVFQPRDHGLGIVRTAVDRSRCDRGTRRGEAR